MSSSAVGRSLFRACMRWAKHFEGVPFALRPFHVVTFSPARATLTAAHVLDGSAQVETLARTGFRECMHDQVFPPSSSTLPCLHKEHVPTDGHITRQVPQIQSMSSRRAFPSQLHGSTPKTSLTYISLQAIGGLISAAHSISHRERHQLQLWTNAFQHCSCS